MFSTNFKFAPLLTSWKPLCLSLNGGETLLPIMIHNLRHAKMLQCHADESFEGETTFQLRNSSLDVILIAISINITGKLILLSD